MSIIQYDKLMMSISSMLIINSYKDYVNVGKDDSSFDYYNIFFFGDFYLKSCIDKCLEEKFYEPIKEKIFTKFCYSSDRGVARYPREGIYFGGSSNLFRMWLYTNTLKHYNYDNHLVFLRNFKVKTVFHEIWRETLITIGEIKTYDDYYTVNLIVGKNTLGHKTESILLNVVNASLSPDNAKEYLRHLLIEQYYDLNSIDIKKDFL